MKKLIVFILSALILCTTYVYTYVYASEEDILIEPIKEEESNIEEEEDIKENEIYSELTPETEKGIDPKTISENEIYSDLIPDPKQEIDTEKISENEILKEILKTNRGIAENVENINRYLSNNSVPYNVLSDNTVSNNLINKPLSEYDLKESLLLFIILLGVSAGLVYIIHKSIFKWG